MSARARPISAFHVLIEPSVAQAAYEVVAPRLRALGRDELAVVRGDVQTAAAFALGVARFVEEPPLRARLLRLAESGELDDARVKDLEGVALAAWYARHRCLLAGAMRSPAQVPTATVDEAIALRARLLSLAERTLGDVPAEVVVIQAVRASVSCQDFAADLVTLGASCGRHAAALVEADRSYQEGEAALARELGEDLLRRINGATPDDPASWAGMVQRAWTLLLRTYEEVRRAGRFLLGEGEGDERFPPLPSVARAGRHPFSLPEMYLADHMIQHR